MVSSVALLILPLGLPAWRFPNTAGRGGDPEVFVGREYLSACQYRPLEAPRDLEGLPQSYISDHLRVEAVQGVQRAKSTSPSHL